MSAPFRELFVELPRALLEVLQGIGEEAVRQARPSQVVHRRPSPLLALDENDVGKFLCKHLRCKSIASWRSVSHRTTAFAARAQCGHKREFEISDTAAIEDSRPQLAIELIARGYDGSRTCFCVERP